MTATTSAQAMAKKTDSMGPSVDCVLHRVTHRVLSCHITGPAGSHFAGGDGLTTSGLSGSWGLPSLSVLLYSAPSLQRANSGQSGGRTGRGPAGKGLQFDSEYPRRRGARRSSRPGKFSFEDTPWELRWQQKGPG